jgi:hypothetical protein
MLPHEARRLMELMTRWVRPASPDADIVKGREGRHVDEEETRTCHQGPKASRGLHDEAGYLTASVPIRAPCKNPWTSWAGPYMTMPHEKANRDRYPYTHWHTAYTGRGAMHSSRSAEDDRRQGWRTVGGRDYRRRNDAHHQHTIGVLG